MSLAVYFIYKKRWWASFYPQAIVYQFLVWREKAHQCKLEVEEERGGFHRVTLNSAGHLQNDQYVLLKFYGSKRKEGNSAAWICWIGSFFP